MKINRLVCWTHSNSPSPCPLQFCRGAVFGLVTSYTGVRAGVECDENNLFLDVVWWWMLAYSW